MSFKTLEVELENGRVHPRDAETLPANGHALLTLLDSAPPSTARSCGELAERWGGLEKLPLAHGRRRVRLLKFAEDGGRNHHLAEKSRQNCFCAAQNEVVQRRSIRDDDAHGRARIFSSVALSAAKSVAE
jgi:hypothetical protein